MEDINQQLSYYVSKCQPVLTQTHSIHITYSSSVIPKTGFVKIEYSEEFLFITAHGMQKGLWRFNCKSATEKVTNSCILKIKSLICSFYIQRFKTLSVPLQDCS